MTSRNNPSVMTTNGSDSTFSTGPTTEPTTPRIRATNSSDHSLSVTSAQPASAPSRKPMPSKSWQGTASARALASSEPANLASPTGPILGPERRGDRGLGVGEVLVEEARRAVDVAPLEQHDQCRVALGLVVGVAPDPVDLRQGQPQLHHQALGHRHQPRRPG